MYDDFRKRDRERTLARRQQRQAKQGNQKPIQMSGNGLPRPFDRRPRHAA